MQYAQEEMCSLEEAMEEDHMEEEGGK